MITRPLLAATLEDLSKLKYPILATPKLDGIRILKVDGKAITRKFKPIPNNHIRTLLETYLPDNIDGEIMTPGTFNDVQSKVMSIDGTPDFTFYAFDYIKDDLNTPYRQRVEHMQMSMENKKPPFRVVFLIPKFIYNKEELMDFESECLKEGFEGVMLREPMGKYKCGRSTMKEQILLKLKRFYDAEARVLGFEERLHNENSKEKDEFGLSKRSSKKVGMKPANTLGALLVEDIGTGAKFGVGSGFDDTLRKQIWDSRESILGKIVKYKYQTVGVKNVPRFPVFLGFRNKLDM